MYFLLLCASALCFAFVIAIYLRSGVASVYHPITVYLAFHGWVFVIRPFFAYFLDYHLIYHAYKFSPSPETKLVVLLCVNLGLIAFVAGALRTGAVVLPFRQTAADLGHRRKLISAFLLAAAMLAPIGAASLWSNFTLTEWTMHTDFSTGVTVNTSANGWFTEAQLLLVPLSVYIAWTFRFRWWSLLPLLLFVTLRAGTGGRGPFIVACFAAALLWLFDRRQRWPNPRVIALAAVALSLFYVVGQDRGVGIKSLVLGGQSVELEKKWDFIESMDWANLEFFEYMVETVPRKTGTYGYFVDNLQIFTEPIPRKLWRNKPVGAPIKLYNLFDYGFPIGMTQSLPGYGWGQAGYVGVIAWCGLWGLVLGAVYARFARGRQGNFEVAAYFAFLPIFVIAFRDGLLITVIRNGVFYLAPVVLWYFAARALDIPNPHEAIRRRQRRARAAVPTEPRARRAARSAEIVPRAWRTAAVRPLSESEA